MPMHARNCLPCHVALSKDTWLLIRVRPCGPFSTTFKRRSRSKMARADTICSQGRGEQGRALPGTFPRVLPPHALCEHVPVPCLVARPLPCSCPALQTRRSTQPQRLHARALHLLARPIGTCVPCTCWRVLSLSLRVCGNLHSVKILNYEPHE